LKRRKFCGLAAGHLGEPVVAEHEVIGQRVDRRQPGRIEGLHHHVDIGVAKRAVRVALQGFAVALDEAAHFGRAGCGLVAEQLLVRAAPPRPGASRRSDRKNGSRA